MKKIGLIDYYLDQYHAHHYPGWLKEASGGALEVAWAWAKQDKVGGKANAACCDALGIELLQSQQDLIERSDCLIVMSPDHPEMHEELCRQALASGKPTYVDKTFAPDRATAQRLIALAEKHSTPFFTTSALRFAKEYEELPREGISFVTSRGPGRFENYAIHQVEPLVCLMGAGICKMMYVGTPSAPAFVFRFLDGRCATMAQVGEGCEFGLAVSYADGHAAVIEGASDFYPRFIARLAAFFADGIPKVTPKETLQVMTILEYGKQAMANPDTWVELPQ